MDDDIKKLDTLKKLAAAARESFKAFLDAAAAHCEDYEERMEDFETNVGKVLYGLEAEIKHKEVLPGMIQDAVKAIRDHDESKEDILVSRALQRVFELGCEIYDDFHKTLMMRTVIDWMGYDDSEKDWTADVKCVLTTTPVAKVALHAITPKMKTPDDKDQLSAFVKRLEYEYTRMFGYKYSFGIEM